MRIKGVMSIRPEAVDSFESHRSLSAVLKAGREYSTDTSCDPINGPKTTGSAVAVFEDYRSGGQGNHRLAIILFRDKNSGKYEHGGGGCDPPDLSERAYVAGKRELLEESRNLFRFPDGVIQNTPFQMTGQYRVHAVKVARGVVRRADFEHNVNVIEAAHKATGKVSRSWREMDHMCRVYIHTLLEDGFLEFGTGNFKTHDTDGNPITIRDRDSTVLLKLLRGDGNRPTIFTLSDIAMTRDPNYDPNKRGGSTFLKGTIQYHK